ncbi:MAG: carbohydrate kinase family protein [Chitinophagaceae bacterium]
MKKNILCIGEVLIDGISTEITNSLQQANTLEIIVGGSVANFCNYLHKCNVDATLVASIGNDGFGKKIIETLNKENISTAYINVLDNCNTSFIAVSKTPQTPDFIAYRDADREISSIDENLFNNANLVHSTAFCLSQQPASTAVLNIFDKAYKSNKLISIDWNYAPSIWKNKAYANEVFSTIQQYQPLLKFSIDDVSRFLEEEVDEQEALYFLSTVSAKLICLTCGSKGVYFKTLHSDWSFLSAKKINVKNATGAGDSFWAGCISAFIDEQNIEMCVQKGIEIASLKLQDFL